MKKLSRISPVKTVVVCFLIDPQKILLIILPGGFFRSISWNWICYSFRERCEKSDFNSHSDNSQIITCSLPPGLFIPSRSLVAFVLKALSLVCQSKPILLRGNWTMPPLSGIISPLYPFERYFTDQHCLQRARIRDSIRAVVRKSLQLIARRLNGKSN